MSIMLGPLVINQYTQTAGIAIAAALFCFKRKRSIPGAVLLALSFLLRKEVCLAMLPLLGFILISYIAKKELKKHIIPVLCAFAVMGISVAIDSYAYSSPEWKEFKAYNEARTDVFDYNNFPEYGKNIDFYNEIGISAEEYTALAEYDLSLADHDTDTFIAMAEKQKSIIKEWNRFSNPYKRALKAALLAFFENIKTLRGFFACAMLVIGFAVAITDAVRNRKKIPGKLVQILITGGYFVAFIGLFAALGRLPERILFGVNMMAILSGLDVVWNVMVEKRASGIISRIYAFGALVIAVAVFSFQAVRVHAELKAMEEKGAAILEIKDKIASDPNSIYFLEANLYKSCGAKMGEKTGNNKGSLYDPANCVKSSDWLYNSPLMKQRYDNLGITGPFDTTSRKKIYYIVPSGLNFEYIDSIVSEKGVDISVISVVDLLK
ncbi:MAG: hypothetical protein K5669_08720 [Lachnospiraceae bacterium]|nr:hypothetical protein [Lachnospiraceae bacterium]